MSKLHKTSSNAGHPYMSPNNWQPGGKCVFWNDDFHNRKLYDAWAKSLLKNERRLTAIK